MSTELIKYAFIAGEISPTLLGRTDLTKYDMGMALAKNWFIDYRGGLTTRPGTEFIDYIKHDDQEVIMMEFQFSPDLSNTYVIMFGHNYIRFIQDGGYVLTGGQSITSFTVGGGKVTVNKNSHGLTNGQWIKLNDVSGLTGVNGHTFVVGNATTNTFDLLDPRTGALVNRNGETGSGGNVYRIYEIYSPFTGSDLAQLKGVQVRDLMRLTHPLFPIHNLRRTAHDNWTLSLESIGGVSFTDLQWNQQLQGSAPGDEDARMTVVYAVAAILEDGQESVLSIPVRTDVVKNFTIEQASVRFSWNVIPGAKEYIVYRSTIVIYDDANPVFAAAGSQLGFVGRTKATYFVDSNIIPDFTKAPYEHYNPFAPGAIEDVTITATGTGYDFLAPISITGGAGTGFVGYAVVSESGSITNVVVLNRGRNYSAPLTVTVVGGGTGATATATVGPVTGMYPSISALFQQRQVYAASLNNPLTLWASQVGHHNIFDVSPFIVDSDSYEFEVDGAQVSPLLHFRSMRGGLLMLSQTGIWLLTGGQSGAVTPTNALADPQSYTGVSPVPPLQIGSDLLYIEGKGFGVRLLSYNDFSKVYSGEDKAILSNHLFGVNRDIVSWAYAETPYRLVFGCRRDGILTMFTSVKEQDVFAWTWGTTRGKFDKVLTINEQGTDSPYVIVKRYIQNQWVKYLERFVIEDWVNVEDSFQVDCGLRVEPAPAAGSISLPETVTKEVDGDFVVINCSGNTFTGKRGWWIRVDQGIYIIDQVLSSTSARCRVIANKRTLIPENVEPFVVGYGPGSWSLSQPQKVFSGLQHLEGEEVSILGDGNVFPKQVVTNGKITLSDGVSKLRVGCGFKAIARNLPPTVNDIPIEAKRKRIVGVAVRLNRSRGLLVGRTLEELYPIRDRTNEAWGAPTTTISGIKYQLLSTEWDEDSQTYFVQEDPLPCAILGLMPDLEIGDDTN